MKDDFTKVEISKADMTDGHELPGAKLKITDASGSTIAEWETNGQPHRIERLKPGDYTLTETAAPNGYLLSEEVYFTVQETGEIQKVTMYDAPAHSLILTKRDIATNAKLADARLTIRDAYGTTIDRWTTTDGDHAIRVLPERSAARIRTRICCFCPMTPANTFTRWWRNWLQMGISLPRASRSRSCR